MIPRDDVDPFDELDEEFEDEDGDEPEQMDEFERWAEIAREFREAAHAPRESIMRLRRALHDPLGVLPREQVAQTWQSVHRAEAACRRIEDFAAHAEEESWRAYGEYLFGLLDEPL